MTKPEDDWEDPSDPPRHYQQDDVGPDEGDFGEEYYDPDTDPGVLITRNDDNRSLRWEDGWVIFEIVNEECRLDVTHLEPAIDTKTGMVPLSELRRAKEALEEWEALRKDLEEKEDSEALEAMGTWEYSFQVYSYRSSLDPVRSGKGNVSNTGSILVSLNTPDQISKFAGMVKWAAEWILCYGESAPPGLEDLYTNESGTLDEFVDEEE